MKFNVFTGKLDKTGLPVPTGTTQPTLNNGEVAVEQEGVDGNFYFKVNGQLYKITGLM